MRALRKIVFINSAHIRYAEIRLDGNVHFIGTQGVGKSTLLRAILFFYNADKLHLGIPREMKSFDEFYLPHANSYIVYEVEHEHGPFSILVNRSSYGRASYRFIDSEYKKEWLIDSLGEVTAEQTVINSRLGKIDWRRVEDYSQYRDIIYGNHKSTDKRFGRYKLMETQSYQNIYRSLQNVFLNSRLDADFIKDIIIRSMNEAEANINLGYYRNQVSDFEQEYKDISCWYRTNQKGEISVRLQAGKVIETYHNLLYMKTQLSNLCGELKYAVRMSREKIPLIEEKTEKLSSEKEKQERLVMEIEKKFDDEKAKLNQALGEVDGQIRKCRERKEHYAHLQIESILARVQQENVWTGQLESLRRRLSDLTAHFQDIRLKFRLLAEGAVSQFESFRQDQRQREVDMGAKAVADKGRLATEMEAKKAEIDTLFAERLEAAKDVVESVRKEEAECEKSLFELKFYNPYETQINDLMGQLQALSSSEKTLTSEVKALAAEINRLVSEYEKREMAIISDSDRQIGDKTLQINKIEKEISQLDTLLSKTRGSLYEWLEDNVEGWEHNIGKVIDEENLLYRTGLRPQMVSTHDAFLYGVSLDLSDLPLTVRKPDELRRLKTEKASILSALKNDCLEAEKRKEADIEALKREYEPKVKSLRERRAEMEVELENLPKAKKAVQVKINELEGKTQEVRLAKLEELTAWQQDIARRLSEGNESLQKISLDKERRMKAAVKEYEDAKAEIDSALKRESEKIKANIEYREKEKDAYLLQLKGQELEQLKGKGADTAAVDSCKKSIESVEAELRFIEANRQNVYNYQKDKEELFDHETDFKSRRKLLSEKIQQLSEKYDARRQGHLKHIVALEGEIGSLAQEAKILHEGLKKAEDFIGDINLCPSIFHDVAERRSVSLPEEVVSSLTGVIVSRQKRQNEFRQSINLFKSNFSAKNTFSFRTLLNTDEDYLDFASNLDDFIQNNKIEDYRSRVNERYIEILRRASKEMGDLTRYESEVDKVIKEINGDFREKNFVGVIKLIALQMKPSADPMVQLMKRIKDFHDENRHELGEVTLFSTTKRDDVNRKAVDYILDFMKLLTENAGRQSLTLSDLFQLEFRVVENDNDTLWVAKLSHVGSEGTDTLVKAMVNIMLINVFKEKVSKKFGDFQIHCMMDEIGKLHPQNVKGILEFANSRNILLINSSPTTYNVSDYRYTYLLDKDEKSNTVVHPLISQI